MKWSLLWGEHVKAFELQAKKTGVTPNPLKTRPRLLTVDAGYYNAFSCLSRARQSGHAGSQPIPISEIKSYCELVGIASREQRSKYLSLVQELDQLCLEHWAELQKQSAK